MYDLDNCFKISHMHHFVPMPLESAIFEFDEEKLASILVHRQVVIFLKKEFVSTRIV